MTALISVAPSSFPLSLREPNIFKQNEHMFSESSIYSESDFTLSPPHSQRPGSVRWEPSQSALPTSLRKLLEAAKKDKMSGAMIVPTSTALDEEFHFHLRGQHRERTLTPSNSSSSITSSATHTADSSAAKERMRQRRLQRASSARDILASSVEAGKGKEKARGKAKMSPEEVMMVMRRVKEQQLQSRSLSNFGRVGTSVGALDLESTGESGSVKRTVQDKARSDQPYPPPPSNLGVTRDKEKLGRARSDPHCFSSKNQTKPTKPKMSSKLIREDVYMFEEPEYDSGTGEDEEPLPLRLMPSSIANASTSRSKEISYAPTTNQTRSPTRFPRATSELSSSSQSPFKPVATSTQRVRTSSHNQQISPDSSFNGIIPGLPLLTGPARAVAEPQDEVTSPVLPPSTQERRASRVLGMRPSASKTYGGSPQKGGLTKTRVDGFKPPLLAKPVEVPDKTLSKVKEETSKSPVGKGKRKDKVNQKPRMSSKAKEVTSPRAMEVEEEDGGDPDSSFGDIDMSFDMDELENVMKEYDG